MDFDGSSLQINYYEDVNIRKKLLTNSAQSINTTNKGNNLHKNLEPRKRKSSSERIKPKINDSLCKLKPNSTNEKLNTNVMKNCKPIRNTNISMLKKIKKKNAIENSNRKLDTALFDDECNLDSFDVVSEKLRIVLKSILNSYHITVVQRLSWPTILKGKDILIRSPSGSGKTLAFLVPIIDVLINRQPKLCRTDGVYGLILVPTKELAKQICDQVSIILRNFNWIVSGGLYGCDKRKAEKTRLRKGLNIVIATPGRLHDHLIHTQCLNLKNMEWFVVDEADLLLDLGYEQKFNEIINCIPSNVIEKCQKIFLSATLSKKFSTFYNQLFKKNTYFIDAANKQITIESNIEDINDRMLLDEVDPYERKHNQLSIGSSEFDYPTNLKQYIIEIPTKLRLIILIWFVKYIIKMKSQHIITSNTTEANSMSNIRIIIFFSSIASADFHCQLFSKIINQFSNESFQNIKLLLLHGSMEIKERIHVYENFSTSKCSILFTTDVAARGLDFPLVDWIIQFNPAREIKEYVHRVGRTCRIGKNGNAILFLEPHEMSYMDLLYNSHLNIEQFSIDTLYRKISTNTKNIEKDVTMLFNVIRNILSEKDMYHSALSAYHASIKAYTSYPRSLKQIFSLKNLHQGHLAESFSIRETPKNISQLLMKSNNKAHSNYLKHLHNNKYKKTNHSKNTKAYSLRSASALLLDEFNGGIISGPQTKKYNKKIQQ